MAEPPAFNRKDAGSTPARCIEQLKVKGEEKVERMIELFKEESDEPQRPQRQPDNGVGRQWMPELEDFAALIDCLRYWEAASEEFDAVNAMVQ